MADFDLVSLVIDTSSINTPDYSIIQKYIDKCSESKDILIKRQSQLDFTIFGYENDPRELCEIIEVVNWANKSIFEGMPWFYFLSTSPNSQGLKLLALCFMAVPEQGYDGCWKFKVDYNRMNDFVGLNITNMNNFIDDNINDETIKSNITEKIYNYYENWLDSIKNSFMQNIEN